MRILTIGNFYNQENVDNISFRSLTTFLDYDVVLIDFRYLFNDYSSLLRYKGCMMFEGSDSFSFKNVYERRKSEINEFLKLGRTLIVYTPKSTLCYFKGVTTFSKGIPKHSITSSNTCIDMLSVLPVEIKTIESSGNNIEFKTEGLLGPFCKLFDKQLSYDAYFQESIGQPFGFIKGTKNAIATYLPFEKGHLIFIPNYMNLIRDKNLESLYFEGIRNLVNNLNKNTEEFELPEWCNELLLPEENIQRSYLEKSEIELKILNNAISIQKKEIEDLEKYKILFSGTGTALEDQVSKVLSELGFEVTEGLPNRDDLILKYKDKVAVVEVKGVTKSAAEKNAAQLEKWVSEYITNYSIHPKGILIVNAYNEIPLDKRLDKPFPHQMISYSKNRGHCLITGIQLLGLYLFCKENPDKKDEMIESLFTTVGLYQGFSDWNSFIEFKGQVPVSESNE